MNNCFDPQVHIADETDRKPEEMLKEGSKLTEKEIKRLPLSIKIKRSEKLILCFVTMFVISLIVGMLVSYIMGPGKILIGLLIGAAVGMVLFLLPMVVLVLTRRR